MRGGASIIAVLLVCILVLVLYFFVGSSQLNRMQARVNSQIAALNEQQRQIREHEIQIQQLVTRLPVWRRQLEVYKKAIPTKVQDEQFLNSLSQEMGKQDVKLLGIQTAPGGAWLGKIDENRQLQLEQMGINVNAARSVLVLFYTVTLVGAYADIINAYEGLKHHRRLYSIDMVTSPAGIGGGAVSQVLDPEETPIQIAGRIYYGIPETYLEKSKLDDQFIKAVAKPKANLAYMMIYDTVLELRNISKADDTSDTELSEGDTEAGAQDEQGDDLGNLEPSSNAGQTP